MKASSVGAEDREGPSPSARDEITRGQGGGQRMNARLHCVRRYPPLRVHGASETSAQRRTAKSFTYIVWTQKLTCSIPRVASGNATPENRRNRCSRRAGGMCRHRRHLFDQGDATYYPSPSATRLPSGDNMARGDHGASKGFGSKRRARLEAGQRVRAPTDRGGEWSSNSTLRKSRRALESRDITAARVAWTLSSRL